MALNDQSAPDEQLIDPGSFEAELFWQKHRKTILGGGVAVIVLIVVSIIWLISSHNTKLAAEAQFADARTPDAWRAVISNYPGSQPAADASFLLAESLRESGKIDDSNAVYRKFLEDFPDHPMVGGARLGLAENLEIQNKLDDAIGALQQVQVANSGSYAAQMAMLLEGRILVRQNKLEDARRILTGLVSTYPTSPAARLAGAQLQGLMPLMSPVGGQ